MGTLRQILTELSARDTQNVRFRTITCLNAKGFQPNLVHALILMQSGSGLLMGKFRQCLIELSARDTIMAG